MFKIRLLSGAIVLIATATLVPSSRAGAEDRTTWTYDATGKYAGTYLCTPEAVGGVMFEERSKRWVGAVFNPAEGTFILQIAKLDDITIDMYGEVEGATAYKMTLKEPGARSSKFCEPVPISNPGTIDDAHVKSAFISFGQISCSDLVLTEVYKFNLEKLRFMSIYADGYLSPADFEDYDRPHIAVGKCTKID
ncbi:hypothetical protein [Mesorhizobium loti]|uniref:hypothetical protein n=1 Tax=Rhizobium loti TaxID=381 RepID=UPI00047D30E5|nr:hypothetical protein [Mesorhizobium loti]